MEDADKLEVVEVSVQALGAKPAQTPADASRLFTTGTYANDNNIGTSANTIMRNDIQILCNGIIYSAGLVIRYSATGIINESV